MMHRDHFFKTFKLYSVSLRSSAWNPMTAIVAKRPPHLPEEDPALYQDNNSWGSNFSCYIIVFK